jgi:hypothetical protein
MREWFSPQTRWHIVLLDLADMASLVFLESEFTKTEGLVVPGEPNYRLLERVAENAKVADYFSRPSAYRHKAYHDALASGVLRLRDDERIAICSAEESEIKQNPRAQYYLLDGVGRCLPYMVLSKEAALKYIPVEAFLAEKRT